MATPTRAHHVATSPGLLRHAMVERLTGAGALRSPPWIAAFAAVPRHVFLRRFFRQSPGRCGWEAVSGTDPGALELIYRDATWVTQLDTDPHRWQQAHTTGQPVSGVPTSSSSAPGLMALILEALDVGDGDQVLEVGTGTGYHAALLCHRLGSHLVTTTEVDPTLAEAARAALHACGYTPTLTLADPTGQLRFDLLAATCSMPAIPPAWLTVLRPGGRIATSLHRDLGGGPLVLLHVHGPDLAEGRFLPAYGSFMPTRTIPPADPAARLATALTVDTPTGGTRAATLGAAALDHPDFGMIAALRLPGVASIGFDPDTGPQRWLIAHDGSWGPPGRSHRGRGPTRPPPAVGRGGEPAPAMDPDRQTRPRPARPNHHRHRAAPVLAQHPRPGLVGGAWVDAGTSSRVVDRPPQRPRRNPTATVRRRPDRAPSSAKST